MFDAVITCALDHLSISSIPPLFFLEVGTESSEQLTGQRDTIIIHQGSCGTYLPHELREKGFTAKVYEAANGVSGVWYSNNYPGREIDVEVIVAPTQH
jgi:cation diffusion facilitator CzcD-associated flavoprotein CzcO